MTQQNQEIINNLLEQQKTSTYAKQLALDKDEAQMSVTRVVTAKYKVYVIFLLILGVILGTQYLPKAWDTYTKIQGTVDFKMQERSSLKMELDQVAKDQKQLLSIQKNKDLIVHCVNNRQGCASLPQDVSKNLDAVISYLQL